MFHIIFTAIYNNNEEYVNSKAISNCQNCLNDIICVKRFYRNDAPFPNEPKFRIFPNFLKSAYPHISDSFYSFYKFLDSFTKEWHQQTDKLENLKKEWKLLINVCALEKIRENSEYRFFRKKCAIRFTVNDSILELFTISQYKRRYINVLIWEK